MKLFKWWDRRCSSSEQALRRLLGKRFIERLVRECHDKRLLMQLSARAAGKDERELLMRVAGLLEIPYAPEVRPAADVARISICSFEKLRDCGVMPVITGGRVVGAIVVDPIFSAPILKVLGKVPVYLGAWFDIARALDLSEAASKTRGDAVSGEAEGDTQELIAAQVLAVVAEDVRAYRAPMLILESADGTCAYTFQTEQGSLATGSIKPEIWPSLRRLCMRNELPDSLAGLIHQIRARSSNRFEVHLKLELENLSPTPEDAAKLGAPIKGGEVLEFKPPKRASQIPERGVQKTAGRVLLVEDNQTFALVISRFLRRHGLTAVHCPNGQAALELLAGTDELPRLLICDVHMPHMNGPELIARIRGTPGLEELPTIALTSDTDVETEIHLVQVGADVFLPKTVDPRVLCAHAERLLSRALTREAAGGSR